MKNDNKKSPSNFNISRVLLSRKNAELQLSSLGRGTKIVSAMSLDVWNPLPIVGDVVALKGISLL
jgi:hypothetical protein